jgi:hypothetical protein
MQSAFNTMRSHTVQLGVSMPLLFSEISAKYFAKQMPQDNIAICLVECVAENLTRVFGVSSQLRHIAKYLDPFIGTPAASPPFDEIDNVDVSPSNSLFPG